MMKKKLYMPRLTIE